MQYLVLGLIFISSLFETNSNLNDQSVKGLQPNIGIDLKGTIRLAYGEDDKIYCMTSTDNGSSFSKPELVARVRDMHLGNTRGPQIASSSNYSMITAIDKEGNIHSFKLDHSKNSWTKIKNVNDQKGSAPEGLMGLTADKNDHFYAVWLDVRIGKKNNIYFASSDKSGSWNDNQLVYKSLEEHVCECCKPNISFNNNRLVITFRNWQMGSRDIYYSISANKGKSFTSAVKSGNGTWQLKGCPMDGGGSSISDKGIVSAAWQRSGDIFLAVQNQPEQKIGSGRSVSMAQLKSNAVIAWQDKKNIKLYNIRSKKTIELGEGNFPRVYLLPNGKTICTWEDNKTISYKVI